MRVVIVVRLGCLDRQKETKTVFKAIPTTTALGPGALGHDGEVQENLSCAQVIGLLLAKGRHQFEGLPFALRGQVGVAEDGEALQCAPAVPQQRAPAGAGLPLGRQRVQQPEGAVPQEVVADDDVVVQHTQVHEELAHVGVRL